MSAEVLTFGNFEIEKNKFYCHKSPIFKKDIDIEKVLVCNKISSGERNYKYFIGYLCNDYKGTLLHITLPKTSAYVKSYDKQTKWMYFLTEDDKLSEKYSTIWDKASVDIKKESVSEPVYDKKNLKTQIKSNGDEFTDFYDKKILRWIYLFSSNQRRFCSQER